MSSAGGRGGRAPWVILGIVALGLFYGVAELFRLRFARGDVYPPYSTLRTDPLGARVLAEGLDAAGVPVSRHLERLDRGALPVGTWYVAGLRWSEFARTPEKKWRALLTAVENGGRLVVTFVAPPTLSFSNVFDEAAREAEEQRRDERDGAGDEAPREGDPAGARDEIREIMAANQRLPRHLGLGSQPPATPRSAVAARHDEADTALPDTLAWHSTVAFAPDDDAGWQTVYAVGEAPVVITRAWGRGTIVLAGDSFHLSNEAMSRERVIPWLVWLQGAPPRAIFDESHHGVAAQHGVASLARRYGLAHVAVVLAVVGLLFVWKNSSSLIPAGDRSSAVVADDAAAADSSGRESAAGLVNLLRRTLEPRAVFAACLAEFRRSLPWRRLPPETQRALDGLAASSPAAHDPVALTRQAHALLARKP